jgi:predicted membrane-bound spermidine synthase
MTNSLPESSIRKDSHRLWLMGVFVASGFAGLIYQSIWSHYLGLLLGHAAYAQALVLSIFMGGMALGSWWVSRTSEKLTNLILWYAWIEAVIGVLGVAFHTIFTTVLKLSYDNLFPALGDPTWISIARWVIAAGLIFPQTVLLGMTFPLMSGGLIRLTARDTGHTLGGLYFTNSIGAAFGVLVAVFVLLPSLGLPGAMAVAGVLNLGVAAVSGRVAWQMRPKVAVPMKVEVSPMRRVAASPHSSGSLLTLVLVATAASSAASFAYEIVWVRMLGMAVGNTMHAFELMLASFIGGLALGGLWVRKRASSSTNPLVLAGWMQVAMGLAALLSLFVYANAFAWVGWLMNALSTSAAGYQLYNLGTAGLAMAIMMPAAFFAGTTLPLYTVALLNNGEGEASIGRVYAWNTLGSIVGVFAAIHLLIPSVGLKLTLISAATLDIAIGLFLLRRFATRSQELLRFGAAGVAAAVVLVVSSRIHFDPLMLSSGVYRSGSAVLDPSKEVLYYKDGKTASVSVIVTPSAGHVAIATNGKVDAAMLVGTKGIPTKDEPTMVLAAALPLAMHTDPQKVGIIGFGSGLTTHTVLGDPRVHLVETVEIEQAMVDGARAFGERVNRAYTDPRSKIIIDDAKAYFAGQQRKYDVIVSEPSNPWISGIGSLYSTEFYQYVGRHLGDDGLFVQWLQLYEINEGLVSTVIRGLTTSFSDYEAWLTNTSDLLIIAKAKGRLPPLKWDQMAEPIRFELNRIGIQSLEQLGFRKLANRDLLKAYAGIDTAYPANSEYLPVLGLYAPQARYMRSSEATLSSMPVLGGLLLEALSIRSPMPSSAPISVLQSFEADHLTLQARALNGVVAKGPSSAMFSRSLAEYDLSTALKLRALLPVCVDPRSGSVNEEFALVLSGFTELTIPFLQPEDLRDTWRASAWSACKNMPPDLKALLALHDVLSQRDWASVKTLGEAWLSTPRSPALSKYFDSVALYGMQLAHLHGKDGQAMLEADAQWGDKVRWPAAWVKHRQIFLALARQLSS